MHYQNNRANAFQDIVRKLNLLSITMIKVYKGFKIEGKKLGQRS